MTEPPSAWDRTVNPTAAARHDEARRNGARIAPCGCTDITDHESDCAARFVGYPPFYGVGAWAYYQGETA
jgi:hypothetical protein